MTLQVDGQSQAFIRLDKWSDGLHWHEISVREGVVKYGLAAPPMLNTLQPLESDSIDSRSGSQSSVLYYFCH